MPSISDIIPNLYNGVSQQPDHVRLPSQCELQENFFSSVVDGLKDRPPREYIAKLADTLPSNPLVHFINRDANEQYVVVITDGEIRVWDLMGDEKDVATPDGVGYIEDSNPRLNFKAMTIADYTFILNRNKTTAADDDTTPEPENAALVVVRLSVAGDYKVTVGGTTYTYTAASGASVNTIAAGLVTQIGTGPGGNYTVTRNANVLKILKTTAGDIQISVTSPSSTDSMRAVINTVQRFSDLPPIAPNDYVVQVLGDNSNQFDDYYVKFTTIDGSSFNEGSWSETVAPGSKYKIDPLTMPFNLVRESDGSFTLKAAVWGERVSGNEESAEDPSFIGRKINDIFLFKNRLGFLSDENIILSRAGKFYDFYPETVITVLDSDPVDISVSHQKVSLLNHAIPYDEDLFVFSDRSQFRLDSGEVLSQKTVSALPVTEFENNRITAPVGAKQNLYFAINVGAFSNIYEYYVSDNTGNKEASDITSHAGKYVPKDVLKIVSSDPLNMLLFLSDDAGNELTVYQYFWLNGESGKSKVQAAWSKWLFNPDCTILGLDFIGSTLYLVTQYDDGVYLEKIDLSYQSDEGSGYKCLLDRRVDETQCTVLYNPDTNQTTVTLPYMVWEDSVVRVVTRPGGDRPEGTLATIFDRDGDTLDLIGDYSDQPFYAGTLYSRIYRFSQFYQRRQTQTGTLTALTAGRTQVDKLMINYVTSGYFQVRVIPRYRGIFTYPFTGRILGSGNNIIGQIALESGVFPAPIRSKNDQVAVELYNDSHLPCKFTGASWTGFSYLVFNWRGHAIFATISKRGCDTAFVELKKGGP